MEEILGLALVVLIAMSVGAFALWPSRSKEARHGRGVRGNSKNPGYWKQAVEDRGRQTR